MNRRPNADALENAWRIHDAQLDWTSKADTKAAFAFGIDSAVIATVSVLASTGKLFSHFGSWWMIALFIGAGACLIAGIVFATIGVAPRLKSTSAKELSKENFIYFGHARHWNPRKLENALRDDDLLSQLTNNIVVAADISWRKHIAVNWSIWLTLVGGALLTAYAILTRV